MLTGMHRAEADEGEVHGSKAVTAEAAGFLCVTMSFLEAKDVRGERTDNENDECVFLVDRSSLFIHKCPRASDVSCKIRGFAAV